MYHVWVSLHICRSLRTWQDTAHLAMLSSFSFTPPAYTLSVYMNSLCTHFATASLCSACHKSLVHSLRHLVTTRTATFLSLLFLSLPPLLPGFPAGDLHACCTHAPTLFSAPLFCLFFSLSLVPFTLFSAHVSPTAAVYAYTLSGTA